MVAKKLRSFQLVILIIVAAIFLPVAVGLVQVFYPSLSIKNWQLLFFDQQFLASIWQSFGVAVFSTVIALFVALGVTMAWYNSACWTWLQSKLSTLLAFPHVAFAIGFSFLFAPTGFVARIIANIMQQTLPSNWVSIQDPYAISLMLALAIKESWFLLWVISSVLKKNQVRKQLCAAQTFGYHPKKIWLLILFPQLLPYLGWPLVAIFAYGLSVVDMALILGPTTPPTLAVLSWQWILDIDKATQIKGQLSALILCVFLVFIILIGRIVFWGVKRRLFYFNGRRTYWFFPNIQYLGSLFLLVSWSAFVILILWSFTQSWFFPKILPSHFSMLAWQQINIEAIKNTIYIGLLVVLIALPLTLCWLEWVKIGNAYLYLTLILPMLPIAISQYQAALFFNLSGSMLAVVWGQLFWVLPYMVLILSTPYREFKKGYSISAKTMGYSDFWICLKIKWPILLKPILAAVSVGFSVSVAQYLPTLFLGAGRVETVVTEAVSLSAGGSRRLLAAEALTQTIITGALFLICYLLMYGYSKRHKGV